MGVLEYILEIGHDYFQTGLEIRHRMDFYTEIGTNPKYYRYMYSRSTQIGSVQDLPVTRHRRLGKSVCLEIGHDTRNS